MRPVILYRKGADPQADTEELYSANNHFRVIHQRSEVKNGDLVIGRYSVLPFYRELSLDVGTNGGRLINSFRQHQFVADMREWCEVLEEMTPRLYHRLQDIPDVGPFVLKGQTNSKKHMWNTHMFARTKREAGEVWSRLRDDMLLSDQEIYARDYVPLVRLATGMNELPISMEFRFFVCYGNVVSGGFYWSSHLDDLEGPVPDPNIVPREFLDEAIRRLGPHVNFYAIDVAKTAAGPWTVVEVNDGQMSGLSCNDPNELYGNFKKILL